MSSLKNVKIERITEFNIIRSEMTSDGELIGGRLIYGDKSYESYDEALDKALDYFLKEGAPKKVAYHIIAGIPREKFHHATYYSGSVYLACNGRKQIEDNVLVSTLVFPFSFKIDKDGYPINFYNQENNNEPFVHPYYPKPRLTARK